ncbi:MAG: glycosyltransferase [Chryseolinea sp.]
MTRNPFFSVVIPTYNRADFIQKTINSVLAQHFSDFEIVVVDDGSTDGTEAIVRNTSDERIKYHKKDNAERGAARNAGIQIAKGNYITFLDSDDILYSHHLSTAFDFLSTHKSPDVFHLAYQIINSEGIVLKKLDTLKSINQDIISGNPLSCMGVFVRQDIMRANLFNVDRKLSGLEDWELWIRIGAKHTIIACNTITSAIIQHDQRSVLENNFDKLILKAERFIQYVSNDKNNQQAYGRDLRKTTASVKTYVALHLAMSNAPKKMVWKYLKEGISENSNELFRKRFLVILKLMAGL